MYEDENKRDIHACSSSAAHHASPRRAVGCRNEPSRCLNFVVVEIEYEQRTSSPIKGRSLLSERRTKTSSSSRHKFLSTALLLRSSPSRLAACTAGRDSRPPKPHLLSPVREKGDKVFGERLARLPTSSARTPRTPTTTSPTSTTSSKTWRTPTPSLVPLLRLLSNTCSCFSC